MKSFKAQYGSFLVLFASICCLTGCNSPMRLSTPTGEVEITRKGVIVFHSEGVRSLYTPSFTIIRTDTDPELKMRPAGIPNVLYNAASWHSEQGDARQVVRTDDQIGDGFDAEILNGDVQARTFSIFNVGEQCVLKPSEIASDGSRIRFSYPAQKDFELSAELSIDSASGYPRLRGSLRPAIDGYYSVGFTGYEPLDTTRVEELWQPMIWQERRFPDRSYATLAYRCPVPSAFVMSDGASRGVVAAPTEFPFDPLPVMENSRFCVALRTVEGKASPMLFAPVPGGAESRMRAGEEWHFDVLLFASPGNTTDALQRVAEKIYGFRDLRHNDISTLNATIDRIIDYTTSSYSWFIDEQKGCAYSTDVPGAVKNVSALNPLEIALLNDNRTIYERRARPILEYMLSREKFLFSADSTQRIQYPSRRLNGPCAPISELTTLYEVFQEKDPFLVRLARQEYETSRVRNLDVREEGRTWKNALHLFRATQDSTFLREAMRGADAYIAARIDSPATDFSDPAAGGFFFWTGFAPKWIDLLELYETTGEERYLKAAHRGARLYTQYLWFCPQVPDSSVVVNPDGKAPYYFYLKQKGHTRMDAAREEVPAWRLSEIGLSPESSGTCTGHRAIFMANHAAWFLRLACYTGDDFLATIAKNAIIGRYRNFPGYHINTARTTVYEKEDYPLRGHKELSVNSFHYNHIMPHVTLLYDYLITDACYRSHGAIRFPDEFIEAYAYLQSKFYGHRPGTFYGEKAWLWMPSGLVECSDVELNYVAARSEKGLCLAFSNQCGRPVRASVRLDPARLEFDRQTECRVRLLSPDGACGEWSDGQFTVEVAPNSLTAVCIEGVRPRPDIQQHLLSIPDAWQKDYAVSADERVRCMLLNTDDLQPRVYLYFDISDAQYAAVSAEVNGSKKQSAHYPYEFTFPIDDRRIEIRASARKKDGSVTQWEPLVLEK